MMRYGNIFQESATIRSMSRPHLSRLFFPLFRALSLFARRSDSLNRVLIYSMAGPSCLQFVMVDLILTTFEKRSMALPHKYNRERASITP